MKKRARKYSVDFKQEAVRRMAQATTIIGLMTIVVTEGTITACEGGNALVDYCKDYVPFVTGLFHAIVNSGGGKSQ
jgi:hypothetical protein